MNYPYEKYLHSAYKPATVTSYLFAIERLRAHYPNLKPLRLADIEHYLLILKKEGKSIAYRQANLAAIKSYFDWLVQENEIEEHPCALLHLDEKKPTGINFKQILTPEELDQIPTWKKERYRYMQSRNQSILGLLVYQGLTSKEICEMQVEDMDLESGIVHVKGQGKNINRHLGLRSNQIKPLLNYIQRDRQSKLLTRTHHLFLSMRGDHLSVDALHELVSKLGAHYHKEISPANIRRSVIYNWVNVQKKPIEDVKEMAGHRYVASTEKYVQEDWDLQRERLNEILGEF